MSRISIDVTAEEHQKLKALAARQGKSIKDYVLERALSSVERGEEMALEELESFLDTRIRNVEKNGVSTRSVNEIFEAVCIEKGITASNA